MKKFIFTLIMLFSLNSISQEFQINEVQIDSGANMYQGTFKYFEPVMVLEVEGDANTLYSKAINWVNETYKNPEEVIKGKVEGEYLRLNGFTSSLISQNILGTVFVYDVRYSVEIKFRDGRFRYEITKMEQYFPPSQYSSGSWVEISFGFKVAKKKGKPNRKTGLRAPGKVDKSGVANFDRVKLYFENLGLGLRDYMMKNDSVSTSTDDDW